MLRENRKGKITIIFFKCVVTTVNLTFYKIAANRHFGGIFLGNGRTRRARKAIEEDYLLQLFCLNTFQSKIEKPLTVE